MESKCLRHYRRTRNLEKDNIVTVIVVKVNSKLYDTDNREETKESIRVILVKIRIEDNIEVLYKEIVANLDPKL